MIWLTLRRTMQWLQVVVNADYKGGIGCWLVEEIVWWFFTVFRTLLFTEKNRHLNGWEDSIDKNLNSWRMEILILNISYILLFAPPSAKQMEIRENLKFRFRFPPLERNKTSIHDGQKNIYCFDTFVLQNPQGKISFLKKRPFFLMEWVLVIFCKSWRGLWEGKLSNMRPMGI